MTTIHTISAMEARRNFGDIMNRIAIGGEEYVIQRAGKPMVKMVSVCKDPFDNPFNSFSEWEDKANNVYDKL